MNKKKILLSAILILFSFAVLVNDSQAVGESIENLLLSATSPDNSTLDDLICTYNLSGTASTAATAWYKNGLPLMTLYMPFEGGEANALLDYSGYGLTGIKNTGVSWDSAAGYDGNGAFQFNGSSYAEIDAGDNMPLGAYTKAAWIKIGGSGRNNIISGNSGHVLWAPESYSYKLSAGHNGSWNKVRDTVPLAFNTWYFVAVTYDPGANSGQMVLYKNGVEVGRATGVPPQYSTDRKIWIGAYKGGYNFNGTIDEVRVYGYALTPQQIWALYNNGQDVITSSETREGDEWQAQVTPFSSTEKGVAYASNIITISGIPPSLLLDHIEILGETNVNENSSTDYNCVAYYADGSSRLVDPLWEVNCPLTGNISSDGLLTAFEVFIDESCTITASYTDGEVTQSAVYNITILNQVQFDPSISSLYLGATSPDNLTTDDLICTYDLSGTAATAATAWYKNGLPLMTLYMPFEGGEANALLDYSGYGLTGIKSTGVSWDSAGGYDGNGAFQFNGSSYAEIDAGNNMPAGAYTKTAWIKIVGSGKNNIISGDSGHVLWAPSSSYYRLSAGHNGSWSQVRDAESLALNTWYFVTVTYDPNVNSGQMVLYKNGAEVARATEVPPQYSVDGKIDRKIWIGAYKGSSNFNGTIDEVRIYGYALTPQQIWALYNNGQDVIASSETREGDEWQAQVTPFSSTEKGVTYASDILTISGAPPVLDYIEIQGASKVIENAYSDYNAIAYYADGSSRLVDPEWGVSCPLAAGISAAGLLGTFEVNANEPCNITASYTERGIYRYSLYPVKILQKNIKIMALGDSITLGSGSSDSAGYRSDLNNLFINAEYGVDFVGSQKKGPFYNFDPDHEGRSGWQADRIRDNVYNWLVTRPADIILLHIGTNDISSGQDVSSIVAEVEQLLNNIDRYENDYLKNITVFLALIINRNKPYSQDGIVTTTFNNQILSMAENRIIHGDNIIIIDQESALDYPSDMYDTVHPNDVGYYKMANTWFTNLAGFLALP